MAIQGGTAMQLPGRQGFASTFYERHRPEQTLLYQLVEAHYPVLVERMAQQGKSLPDHVHREFEAYLKCGRLEHGSLRVRCDKCHFERLVALCGQSLLTMRALFSAATQRPAQSVDGQRATRF